MRIRSASLAAVVALVAAACSASRGAARPSPSPSVAATRGAVLKLPSRVLGLAVVKEDISGEIKRTRSSYLDSVALFGLRERKVLRAALEVGRFNDLARPQDPSFRAAIANQAGASVPRLLRVGETTVYLSTGKLQYTFLWFSGRWMYVLTVRRDYPFPRMLLRRLIRGSAQ